MSRMISLLLLFLGFVFLPDHLFAADGFRTTSVCSAMTSDASTGVSVSAATVKATAANRVLRQQVQIPVDECVSFIEIAGATTAPGGPIFASLYVLRSESQQPVRVGTVSIPEGKSGVYKASFPLACFEPGDAPFIVIALNAGGGVPSETASCSYAAVGN